MIPIFNIFGKDISAYMIMGAIGALAALYFGYKQAKKSGLDEINMTAMFCLCGIGILLGGHLMYGITMYDKLILVLKNIDMIDSFQKFTTAVKIVFGGSVFYGGLIGVLIIGFVFCKKQKLDMGAYFDVGAAAIPLFHFFGRLGCFLGGCCYGIPCDFGVTFHYSPVESCNGVRRFPVQLVEAFLNLCLFFFLTYCIRRGFFKRRLLGLYCLIYPCYRYILEFYRDDDDRGTVGILSTSQFISLVFIIVTIFVLIYINRQSNACTQACTDKKKGGRGG